MRQKVFNWQIFWLVIVIIILLGALFLGYYITFHSENSPRPLAKDDMLLENYGPAPDFSLPDLEGNSIALSNLRGKIVLVDFWGTWCQSCCDEMPDMDKVYRRYREKGFEMIGIAIEFDRDPEKRLQKVRRKVEELGATFTIVIGDDAVVTAFGGKMENFPQTYLIDRNGQIRKRIVGARPESYWESLVRSAFSE